MRQTSAISAASGEVGVCKLGLDGVGNLEIGFSEPAEQPQAGPAVRPVFGFRKTGFWLEELAAPYYVFEDAGAPLSPKSPINGTR
jgi:hypothetical protein